MYVCKYMYIISFYQAFVYLCKYACQHICPLTHHELSHKSSPSSPLPHLLYPSLLSEDDENVENRELQEGEVEKDESWPPLDGKYDPLGN